MEIVSNGSKYNVVLDKLIEAEQPGMEAGTEALKKVKAFLNPEGATEDEKAELWSAMCAAVLVGNLAVNPQEFMEGLVPKAQLLALVVMLGHGAEIHGEAEAEQQEVKA